MSKLKNPLLSLGAKGALGDAITFLRRRKQDIVEKTPKPEDAKSLAQLSWRHMYQKAVALWHALSAEEKQEWESLARKKHMTGFAWFVSQALKPNPGLYLPLQGGTMSGGIDMAKNWIRNVRKPLDDQEPATKEYTDDAIVTHKADADAHHPVTVATSGVYSGNSTVNRAIAHGLGVIPKIVHLKNLNAGDLRWFWIYAGQLDYIQYLKDTESGAQGPTTPLDATNFYVGRAADYFQSANNTASTYIWVAIG